MSKRAQTFLFYSETNCGKTSQLGEIASWHHARTGEITRLISADSGWDPISHLVITPDRPDGIIEAWNVQGLPNPWGVFDSLSRGGWPSMSDTPSGPRLRMSLPKWDGDRIVSADGRRIGQVFLEGLNTIAALAMQDHTTTGRKLAQDVVTPFASAVDEVDAAGKVTTRSISYASASQSHYGQVQRWLLEELVPKFGKLSVARVVWTAHEARGTDDISGITNSVLGPATIGKAYVDKTTQKFGHSFHLTSETTPGRDAKGNPVIVQDFRAWFVKHPDATLTKMQWPAKVSLSISRARELLRKYPGGFIPLNQEDLTGFLEFLDAVPDGGQTGGSK